MQCVFFNVGTGSFKLFTQDHGTHNPISYPKEGNANPIMGLDRLLALQGVRAPRFYRQLANERGKAPAAFAPEDLALVLISLKGP
jgi:hypothetical protein